MLVTGDSQAEFVGQRHGGRGPGGLLHVDVVARNGTGLTRPEFFNWEVNARQEIADRHPDAVVMVMGANDGFNVTVDGRYGPFTPEWETEYARRTAVVMRELGSRGRRPVYWAPPPTARDEEFNRIYRVQNFAVARAAGAVPGARYVNFYNPSRRPLPHVTKIDGHGWCPASPTGFTSRATGRSRRPGWWWSDGPGLPGAGALAPRQFADGSPGIVASSE